MFAALIEKLQRRQDLTIDEAAAAMDEIMEGRAQPAQIAGLLIALAMKGERPAEIVGLARTMRGARDAAVARRTRRCSTRAAPAAIARTRSTSRPSRRWCSRRAGSASPSTATDRCRAGAAARTCSRRSACTSPPSPTVVERCLDEAGIAFFFAPTFHPSMRHAAPTRRELGVRTAFNLLGPLTNPAGASRQLVGVPRPELTELVARSLALLGSERAWVVHGADGLDEISTTGYTKVSECRDGAVNTFYVHPSDFGLPKAAPAALRGGDAADNAAIARARPRRRAGARRATSCC